MTRRGGVLRFFALRPNSWTLPDAVRFRPSFDPLALHLPVVRNVYCPIGSFNSVALGSSARYCLWVCNRPALHCWSSSIESVVSSREFCRNYRLIEQLLQRTIRRLFHRTLNARQTITRA